jgi:hypothetical protein
MRTGTTPPIAARKKRKCSRDGAFSSPGKKPT